LLLPPRRLLLFFGEKFDPGKILSTNHYDAAMTSPQLSSMERFLYLDAALQQYRWLWSVQPFKQRRPPWCEHLPELTEHLLNLTDEQVESYSADSTMCLHLLASALPHYQPQMQEFSEHLELPRLPQQDIAHTDPHIVWEIPGRKWRQIEAFQRSVAPAAASVVEWCGGKGHLGRLLARQWRVPVTTLEWNETLCREGTRLALRAAVPQRFHHGDIRSIGAEDFIRYHHAVALHACGALHRKLLNDAVAVGVPALDLVPCCYAHGLNGNYAPFSALATLNLTRDDVRLAVTDSATATAAQVRLRDREMAWKLGFGLMRQTLQNSGEYQSISPIDKSWLSLPYHKFCGRLAQRDRLALPATTDWQYYESAGWLRQREVMRLSLVRNAFRRAVELWLVLDMVNYLTRHGYRVILGTFCDRAVSPRNILLSARKAD
jgi:hypothetical protein